MEFGGIAGFVLMLVGWWLLYQRTPTAPEGTAADQRAAMAATTAPVYGPQEPVPADQYAENSAEQPAAETVPTVAEPDHSVPQRPVPPSWDPLGAAPFAWDLPEPPTSATTSEKQPKNALTYIVPGLAVLTAAAGAAGHAVGIEWFTVGRIASLALAVLGIGMLIASLQRRPSGGHADGLVGLALLTAAIAVVATLAHQNDFSVARGGIGDREWRPHSESDLLSSYRLGVGSSVLDLSDLPSIGHDRTISVQQGVGDLTVRLPEKVRVRAECSTGVGDISCPQGIVGDGDGPILTIQARNGLGDVEMTK
ncbi:MAG: LiaF-related protein [Gordonia sp. (in: high G+C Gram-positive bacteria)]|uniref:PspC domain-containing protein n=1 Tax=Gordonia sp. (in: high G+C Gram-positive bacteria) TaxID=84139 RepID=UPI0039E2F4F0